MTEASTMFRVVDERGQMEEIRSVELADRLSRAGLRVTAVSHSGGRR